MGTEDADADGEILRIEALAARWNCSCGKIREMIRAGKLSAVRSPGARGVPIAAVIAFEAENPQLADALGLKPRGGRYARG